ncbi:glycosyltransferase family 2 protein [Pseudomonas syringae]|nr:glycosyltransferase family 2 protein [Pseudomonas syringae]
MKIAIGAIFKNEFEYILEWLAWHQIAGFKDFCVADNNSTDRTTALLESLEALGLIRLFYQPTLEKNAQYTAYRKLCQTNIGIYDAFLFIDADEFLVHDAHIPGAEYQLLSNIASQPEVGMIGINWKCYGSSNHEHASDLPVMERFTKHASDLEANKNNHLKSLTKLGTFYELGPHISYLYPPYKRVDVTGKEIKEFIDFVHGKPEAAQDMPRGISKDIVPSPLRIHHYVIKSREEFNKKKLGKGDPMGGETYKKTIDYFNNHNFSDEESFIPEERLDVLKIEIEKLQHLIHERTVFSKKLMGAVDKSNEILISGWICEQDGGTPDIYATVFVNGLYQGKSKAASFRPDLKDNKISKTGFSGFQWHHAKPLKKGDVVDVKVYGNNCSLMGNKSIVI